MCLHPALFSNLCSPFMLTTIERKQWTSHTHFCCRLLGSNRINLHGINPRFSGSNLKLSFFKQRWALPLEFHYSESGPLLKKKRNSELIRYFLIVFHWRNSWILAEVPTSGLIMTNITKIYSSSLCQQSSGRSLSPNCEECWFKSPWSLNSLFDIMVKLFSFLKTF